jgi:hypothetical protein
MDALNEFIGEYRKDSAVKMIMAARVFMIIKALYSVL